MQYKISGDEMQIVLEKGDLQTDPPPSLSPTCASAMVVGLEEVKKLLVDLLPVVEGMKELSFVLMCNKDKVFVVCPACHAQAHKIPGITTHTTICPKIKAIELCSRLRKMIEELGGTT